MKPPKVAASARNISSRVNHPRDHIPFSEWRNARSGRRLELIMNVTSAKVLWQTLWFNDANRCQQAFEESYVQ
jgi:hypothetical protein